jgi:hypothetical protein
MLQDSSVKIADDEGVSPRVMYKILSKTAPNKKKGKSYLFPPVSLHHSVE